MAKSQEQKIKEIEMKAANELVTRLEQKRFSLERKYQKMIDLREEKLKEKQEKEFLTEKKKIERQVHTKMKNKIRKVKWHKEVKYRSQKVPIQKLKNSLLRTIQKYCRLRDTGENWYWRCISCPKIRHWKWADWWHFISRAVNSTAFDERNINLQCKECNWFKNWNTKAYRLWMIEKYGIEVVQEIEQKAGEIFQLDREWMWEQLNIYKEKVRVLEAKKK